MTGRRTRLIARFALAAGGLALLAILVRGVGVGRVASVLRQAGSLLPIIVALEVAQLSSDFVALRSLLRDRGVRLPGAAWVRSSAIAYAMMILLPAGRAAGEVARGALVARDAGAAVAARASTELQSSYVFANGIASAVAAATVGYEMGSGAPLALLLAVNASAMFALSFALLLALRDARVGRWLHRQLTRLGVLRASAAPSGNPAVRPVGENPLAARVPW
ncbi:MAG TPA: hypothetical protein VKU41_20265, partial [Polyangiaceae bacterium]|nr:hypothetical protein [Polyangiaceae bacterium]